MINGVIFDLDGTLADSGALSYEALKLAADGMGLHAPSIERIKAAMGYPNPEFYYLLFPDVPAAFSRRLGEQVERLELEIMPGLGDRLLFPGCAAMLRELHGCGFSLYIASTGDKEHVNAVLRETGIYGLFTGVYYGMSDKSEALKTIITNHSEFVMVGDMRKDWEAAKKNGILAIGCLFGYCRRESSQFDYYAASPGEIPDLLRRLKLMPAGSHLYPVSSIQNVRSYHDNTVLYRH